jgi:outer membrane protein assembly factor BamB
MTYFDERLDPLREQVRKAPRDRELIERYRAADLERRLRHLESRRKLGWGGALLLVGLAVFAFSMRRIQALSEKPPVPLPPQEATEGESGRKAAMVAVPAAWVPVALGVLLLFYWEPWTVPVEEKAGPSGPVVIEGPRRRGPVPPELRWPGLRGPGGMGTVKKGDFPKAWDAAKGENLLWKTAAPLPGHSSAVVWGPDLFVTGATLQDRKLFCFDRETGKLRWECAVKSGALLGADFEAGEDTGLASPTPATDGERVFVFFGTAELAAVDFSGRLLWSRWFGKPESIYGLATSPVYYDGTVYLQLDQGMEGEGKSFLYAIDPKDGETKWKTARDVPNSWSTPVVARTELGAELVTAATPWAISYDPSTGTELWRANVLTGDVAPLPVFADAMVYTVTEYSKLSAIRTGGSGNVTDSHVAWTHTEDLPDVSSPVSDGRFLVMANAVGTVTCLDAKEGTVLWRKEFDKGFWSSPTLVGRNVYLTDKTGRTVIFEMAGEYRAAGSGTVVETVTSTPAFVDGKIYLRGTKHLYAIGTKGDEAEN